MSKTNLWRHFCMNMKRFILIVSYAQTHTRRRTKCLAFLPTALSFCDANRTNYPTSEQIKCWLITLKLSHDVFCVSELHTDSSAFLCIDFSSSSLSAGLFWLTGKSLIKIWLRRNNSLQVFCGIFFIYFTPLVAADFARRGEI